jgi:DNA-binding transcriptional ArsR family regulator
VSSSVQGDIDIAAAAALMADPARAAMLRSLMDGGTLSSGELARRAQVAASTGSEHLKRLLAGGFVVLEVAGREHLYRLASTAVADTVESVARLGVPGEVLSLRGANRAQAMRTARICYDHIAGRLGVGLTEALVVRGALFVGDNAYDVTGPGERQLAELGVDVDAARERRRSFARACLDWSERRPHLAGALGAALADALLARAWVLRRPADRGLQITAVGGHELARLGVELA